MLRHGHGAAAEQLAVGILLQTFPRLPASQDAPAASGEDFPNKPRLGRPKRQNSGVDGCKADSDWKNAEQTVLQVK